MHSDRDKPSTGIAVTHPGAASLLLQLVALRQEAETRKARRWFDAVFRPAPLEQWQTANPAGSESDRYFRMVVGHWQMVAVMWKQGYLPSELLFPSTREFRRVWERCSDMAFEKRTAGLTSRYLAELEEMCDAFDAWLAE